MNEPLLTDPRLYPFMLQADRDLACETQKMGCPHCGGVLHSAQYPRKPMGFSAPPGHEEIKRFSFCCSTDGCRRRVTPPSVRFLGRKRYLGAVVILLSAMMQGPSPKRSKGLRKLIGVSRKTLLRWQRWWRETFLNSRFWRYGRGLMMPPLDATRMSRELVERFYAQDDLPNLIKLLRFLSPIACPSPLVELRAI